MSRYNYCPHAHKNAKGLFICGTKTQRAGEERPCHCVYFCRVCGGKWLIMDEAKTCKFREDYHGN